MRACITGASDYRDKAHLYAVLDALGPGEIAHSGAAGAALMAGRWATGRQVPCRVYSAKWERVEGHGELPIRNGAMLSHFRPDVIVIFAENRGTVGRKGDLGIPRLLACSEEARAALRTNDPRSALLSLLSGQ